MITTHYVFVLFITCAWIWGFEYTFKPGEIFGSLGYWMNNNLPEALCKPTFACKYCMSSVHGSVFFMAFLYPQPIYMWVIFCFALTGLTAMIDKK